jgi:hypothetical protein
MGSTIGRIEKEFILNSVCDHAIPLSISAYKLKEPGILKVLDDDYLLISGEKELGSSFPAGSDIRVYFSYYGHVMTFATRIRGVVDDDLKTEIPESIHKNLTRKFERVRPPTGVEISFEIQAAKIDLNFPKSEEYDPVDEPEWSEEYDSSDIQSLLGSFRERVKDRASVNSVTMFRGRPPKGFEETLISQTGKIFYLPDTSGVLPADDYQSGGRIVTRGMLLRPDLGNQGGVSQDRLPELIAEKKAKGIGSEIYCPIIFHEYTIGFVYLARREGEGGAFDDALVEETHQFSKILAYALKVGGYFKEDIPGKSEYSGEIIDISASGLLFANNSEQLDLSLVIYADIDLRLRFDRRVMNIASRTMRKLRSASMNYYGIQFMEIKPEDFRFLFDLVYGRAITSEDEQLWEGGAAPPELSLD